jgi:hypothetical protein
MSMTESSTTELWEDFEKEAKAKIMPTEEAACTKPSSCRNQDEVLYIAYKKSILLQEKLSVDKIFIVSVDPNLYEGGVSKVVFSAKTVEGVGGETGGPLLR